MSTAAYQRYLDLKSRQFSLKSDIELSEDEIAHILGSKTEISSKRLDDIRNIMADKVEPSHINPMSESGTFCLLFETIATENHKIIKSSLLPDPYFSFDFFIEKSLMEFLQEKKIPVISISSIDCSRKMYDFDYMIMEKVNGFALSVFTQDMHKMQKCLFQLGKMLAKIHTIKISGFGPIVKNENTPQESYHYVGIKKSWKDYLYTQLNTHIRYCFDKKITDLTQTNMIEKLFADYESVFDQPQGSLLHGDLSNQNIFIQKENDEIILIDWGDALIGDHVFDIAMWGSFVGNHEKLDFLIKGYQSYSNLEIDFELRYWLYYLRIMLAKTVHRHRFKYYKTDKIPSITRILLPLEKLSTVNGLIK